MRTPLLPVVALTLVATACVAPGAEVPEDETPVGLQEPTFGALPSEGPATSAEPSSAPTASASPTPTTPTPDAPASTPPSPNATSSPDGPGASPTPTAPPPVTGTLSDGTGDLEGLNSSRAPGYADLRDVRLEMGPEGGTIRIDFAAPAPEAGEGDEIVNVATYHDVTGDGRVDYEIWASLTADGWGTSWYDLRAGTARFAAEDDVEVSVESGTLVLDFPAGHLDGARSGQWLASSEWHTGLMRTTGANVTDDAPDDRAGRVWPS